jgi:signal transduction histidine kinase/ActR/RegA family two-component response regulator
MANPAAKHQAATVADLSNLGMAIAEHAPLPMATVEGAGHVVRYVNPAFCRLMGQPRDRFLGKPFREVLPAMGECASSLDRVYRTGAPETRAEPQQSSTHPVFWSYQMWPVIVEERRAGVFIQVTETGQVHARTVAMNQALVLGSVRQHELAEAADAANAQIREADLRKDEFLAMLAHELRNPLAPISYMLEVMKRAQGNFELIGPALGTMERQIAQMTRLIDDLLDASRISQGKVQLRLAEVELATVIQQAVEAARSACEAAQLELTVTLPAQPVYLHADAARLAQVFGNLLNNACKFSSPGGRLELAVERRGSEVVVAVSDSGIGIRAEMLPTIFEMFMQGDQSLGRSQGGLGIGLTLVRRLVEMHGGSVEAFSEGVDRGSEFVVRLPMLDRKPDRIAPDPAGAGVPISARRILVVDDNYDAANSLALLLQLSGNQTQLAFDGVEAVEAAATFRPDVILMDIGMPKLNGYDAARRIREQPGGKEVVMLALTGWGQEEDRQKTADAGFDGHLVKPVEYEALGRELARCSTPGQVD